MSRLFALASVLCALAFVASACSEDTSLEDLGDEVQATQLALATLESDNATRTPQPTSTPEPEVFAHLRTLGLHAQDIDSFFNFLRIRLEPSSTFTIGSIGDEDGNFVEGWIQDCCERQWSGVQETITDAATTLHDVQVAYDEEGSAEHLALVSTAQEQLDEASATLDALPEAVTLDAAAFVTAAGLNIIERLSQTISDLNACCEPAPAPGTAEPLQ